MEDRGRRGVIYSEWGGEGGEVSEVNPPLNVILNLISLGEIVPVSV